MARALSRRSIRLALLLMGLVAATSIGGGFLFGVVLAPLLILASGAEGWPVAGGYLALAGVLAAELGWAAAHMTAGESSPLIWIVPLVLAAIAIGAGVRLRRVPRPLT